MHKENIRQRQEFEEDEVEMIGLSYSTLMILMFVINHIEYVQRFECRGRAVKSTGLKLWCF